MNVGLQIDQTLKDVRSTTLAQNVIRQGKQNLQYLVGAQIREVAQSITDQLFIYNVENVK